MRRRRNLTPIVLIGAAILTAAAALRGQQADTVKNQQVPREVNENQYPVAEYQPRELSDPAERAKRLARGRRYDFKHPRVRAEEIKQLELTEDSPAINLGGPWTHSPVEPAFPVDQSSVIITGEVTGASAYLSNDRTQVYSEFTVTVTDTLANETALPISAGASITAARAGGRVRLPSGKVLIRGQLGRAMPSVGGRYLLFLRYNDEGEDFSIITGYELRDGRVYPLDGAPVKGGKIPQYAAYEAYSGAYEARFLSEVYQAIANARRAGGAQQ